MLRGQSSNLLSLSFFRLKHFHQFHFLIASLSFQHAHGTIHLFPILLLQLMDQSQASCLSKSLHHQAQGLAALCRQNSPLTRDVVKLISWIVHFRGGGQSKSAIVPLMWSDEAGPRGDHKKGHRGNWWWWWWWYGSGEKYTKTMVQGQQWIVVNSLVIKLQTWYCEQKKMMVILYLGRIVSYTLSTMRVGEACVSYAGWIRLYWDGLGKDTNCYYANCQRRTMSRWKGSCPEYYFTRHPHKTCTF